MGKVSFKRGTSEQFASKVPDNDTIYFLTDTNEICLGSEIYSSMDHLTHVENKMTVAQPALTERLLNGTKILNQIWVDRACVQLGAYYVNNSLSIAVLVSYHSNSQLPSGYSITYHMLYQKNATGTPYEFTLENNPNDNVKNDITVPDIRRVSFSGLTPVSDIATVDFRGCLCLMDSNGNIVDKVYSAQYRYSVNVTTSEVQRTLIETAPTSKDCIIDIGIFKDTAGFLTPAVNYTKSMTFSDISALQMSYLLRYVIDVNYVGLWIPDTVFGDDSNMSLIAIAGDNTCYIGPVVYKATADYDGTIYEIYDGSIEVTEG